MIEVRRHVPVEYPLQVHVEHAPRLLVRRGESALNDGAVEVGDYAARLAVRNPRLRAALARLEEKSARVFLAAGEILDLRRLVSRHVRAVSAEDDSRLGRAAAANAYDRLVADVDVRRVRVPVHEEAVRQGLCVALAENGHRGD